MNRDNFCCSLYPMILDIQINILRAYAGFPAFAVGQSYEIYKQELFICDWEFDQNPVDERIKTLVDILFTQKEKINQLDKSIGGWLKQRTQLSSHEILQRCITNVGNGILSQINPNKILLPDWIDSLEYSAFLQSTSMILFRMVDVIEEMIRIIQVYPLSKPDSIVVFYMEDEIGNFGKYIRIILDRGFSKGIEEVHNLYDENSKKYKWLFSNISGKVKIAVDRTYNLSAEDAIKVLLPLYKSRESEFEIAELSLNLAIKYEDLEHWEEAEKYYSRYISIMPATGTSLLGRARALLNLGKYDEAIVDLEKSLTLSPRQTYILSDLQKNEVEELLVQAKGYTGIS
jgi:hypothetical protein